MSGSSYTAKNDSANSFKDALLGVVSLLLGLLVAVLGLAALMMWLDARNARDDVSRAQVTTAASSMPGMDMSSTNLGSLTSYAGAAPANADALAAAHKPYPCCAPGRARGGGR